MGRRGSFGLLQALDPNTTSCNSTMLEVVQIHMAAVGSSSATAADHSSAAVMSIWAIAPMRHRAGAFSPAPHPDSRQVLRMGRCSAHGEAHWSLHFSASLACPAQWELARRVWPLRCSRKYSE